MQHIEAGNSPTSSAALIHAKYTPMHGPSGSASKPMHLYLSQGDRIYMTENAKERIAVINQLGGHLKEKK